MENYYQIKVPLGNFLPGSQKKLRNWVPYLHANLQYQFYLKETVAQVFFVNSASLPVQLFNKTPVNGCV